MVEDEENDVSLDRRRIFADLALYAAMRFKCKRDPFPKLRGAGRTDEYIGDDGIHPTEAGYEALARQVAAKIRELL